MLILLNEFQEWYKWNFETWFPSILHQHFTTLAKHRTNNIRDCDYSSGKVMQYLTNYIICWIIKIMNYSDNFKLVLFPRNIMKKYFDNNFY